MNIFEKIWLFLFKPKGELTTMITLEKCPKCGSMDTHKKHHAGSFALPECFFQQCDECDHQWNHT